MPKELQHPQFYMEDITPDSLFREDSYYYRNKDKDIYPWNSEELNIQELIGSWEPIRIELKTIFKNRNYNLAKPLVIRGISIFLQLLYWSNKKPVDISNIPEGFDDLDIKPANLSDRFMFILQNPQLYHSFVQLSELFVEQHKTYSKFSVMKKRTSKTKY